MSAYFDPQFYANMNSDLLRAGLNTHSQLQSHWDNHGIAEGRHAHPDIHAPSYLARYPDLRNAFGVNYRAAHSHYVTNGAGEQRDGTNHGLLTARANGVSISASPRQAGALDSLFFAGKESCNSYDHGRQVQSACLDTRYEGCFNPTQAGSRWDGLNQASTSQLQAGYSIASNKLYTRTKAAYWARPGETLNDLGVHSCTASTYTSPVSDFVVSTDYSLIAKGSTTLIKVDTTWTIGRAMPANTFMCEGITGYHTADFSTAYEVVPENGYAARPRHIGDHLLKVGQERVYPAIISIPDGSRAIGIYTKPTAGVATRYATWNWNFGYGQQINDCSKWTSVRRVAQALSVGDTVSCENYIVVGQLTPVHLALRDLMIEFGT